MKFGRSAGAAILLLFLLLTSCRPEADTTADKTVETQPVVPDRIVATSTVDRLRVRSLPYLDGDVVAFLSAGESVVVESRTSWNQRLDDMDTPWYFIRTDTYSGWTYGGFLLFRENLAEAVPVNPALPEPVETVPVDSEGPLDPVDLPEILLPVFGLEGEAPSFPQEEGTIVYDPEGEYLILPFDPLSDSALSTLANQGGRLKLVAEHSSGLRYEYNYGLQEIRLFSALWSAFTTTDGREALMLPFYRLATLPRGSWEFYAFADNENWPAAIGKADIVPVDASAVASNKPVPMKHSPRDRYTPGDTVFCFGNSGPKDGTVEVALYFDTQEIRENMVLLRPTAGRRVPVDSDGVWNTSFAIGPDLVDGRYWVAVGDPIEGIEDVKLFITSVEISR